MMNIQNVSKTYGETEALRNIQMTVPQGVCYGLVGPNGAGKSTLMKILVGIIQEYDGSVHMDAPSLGYVRQEICLEETLTAASNIHFYGKIQGSKGKT